MFSHLWSVRVAPLAAAAGPGRPAFSPAVTLIGALIIAVGLEGNLASSAAAFEGSGVRTQAFHELLTLTHCRRTYHCGWSTREYGTRADKKVWRCHVCP
jgi:hypothetical protein